MENKRNKKTKILFILAALFTFICSFGLVACSWGDFGGNKADTSSETVDAQGRKRIPMVSVDYNKIPTDGSVNESTGSFEWDLSYYFDDCFENSADAPQNEKIAYITADSSTNYAVSFSSDADVSVNSEFSVVKGLTFDATKGYWTKADDDTAYYSIEYATLKKICGGIVENGTTLNNLNSRYLPKFASYEISNYDNTTTRITLTLNRSQYENLYIDYTNKTQLFSLKEGVDVSDLFTISYTKTVFDNDTKEYKIDTVVQTAENYNVAKVYVTENGRFRLVYNPILTKGSQSRYIRVSSLSSSENRGDSIFTAPTKFNVYQLNFSANCSNSSENKYKALTYDKNKYYFASETAASTGDEYTQLTGYFVEGKVVNVQRSMDINSDYALQKWTNVVKAQNSYVLSEYLPEVNNEKYAYDSNFMNKSCLTSFAKETLGAREVEIGSATNLNTTNNTKSYKESIVRNNNYYIGTLSVASYSGNNLKTFYANVSKVKNFNLNGNIYDAEDLIATTSTILDGVDIYIWKNGASKPFAAVFSTQPNTIQELATDDVYDYDAHIASMGIERMFVVYENGHFEINGLAYDTYISFAKESIIDENEHDHNYYTFFSEYMTKLVDDSNSIYVLNQLKNETLYADRIGNAIYGTKYETNTEVAVNLFVIKGNKAVSMEDEKIVDPVTNDSVRYQVISTTTEETDKYGYTTSKVIISLLLPSNYTLKSYNVESVTNIGEIVYENSNSNKTDFITCKITYDEINRTVIKTYYYTTVEEISGAVLNTAKSTLYYDDQPYEFSRRDYQAVQGGNDTYLYYYTLLSADDTESLKATILRQESSSSQDDKFILYSYTKIDNIIYQEADLKEIGETESFVFLSQNSEDVPNSEVVQVNYSLTYYENKAKYDDKDEEGTFVYSPDNYRNTAIDVVADVYATGLYYNQETGLQYEANQPNTDEEPNVPIYIYYDVNSYSYFDNIGNPIVEYYYTKPVGKLVSSTEVNWFNDEFKQDTKQNSYSYDHRYIIALGSLIIQHATDADFANFVNAIGGVSHIIADYYYLVKQLNAPVRAEISQYVNTDKDTHTTSINSFVYYVEGDGKYILIGGKYVVDGDYYVNKYVKDGNIYTFDENGDYIATSVVEDANATKQHFVKVDDLHYTPVNSASENTEYYVLDDAKTKNTSNFATISSFTKYSYDEESSQFVQDDEGSYIKIDEAFYELDKLVKFNRNQGANNSFYYYYAENGTYVATKDVYVEDTNYATPHYYEQDGIYIYEEIENYTSKKYSVIEFIDYANKSEKHYVQKIYTEGVPIENIDRHNYGLKGTVLVSNNKGQVISSEETPTTDSFESIISNGIYSVNDKTYVLSTNTGKAYWSLYSYKGSTISSYVGNLSSEFKNQEKDNKILENIHVSSVIQDEKQYYYIDNRKTYDELTILYNVYIVKTEDQSNQPGTFGFTLYLANDGKYYAQSNEYVYITNDNGSIDRYPLISPIEMKDGSPIINLQGDDGQTVTVTLVDNSTKTFNTTNSGYSIYVQREYYKTIVESSSSTSSYVDKATLGEKLYVGLIDAETVSDDVNEPTYILYGVSYKYISTDYSYTSSDGSITLYAETLTATLPGSTNNIVRKATLTTGEDIHVIGKVVLLGNGETDVYPTFDYYNEGDSENIIDDVNNYYDIDYTTVKSVISAFPGVSLLAGAPYTNPVFSFEVRHKAEEQAVLNFGLEIVNGYYVELLTNAIASAELDLIYDFSTITFKDTITNLTNESKMDKLYYVVMASTLQPIVAYTKVKITETNENGDIVYDENGQPKTHDGYVPYLDGTYITVLNIGMNDNSTNLYSTVDLDENGRYKTPLYYLAENGEYLLLNSNELNIWSSSAESLENVPYFDIHTYYIADNGIINLYSDSLKNDNSVCTGVENIYISGFSDSSNTYNYDEVLIGGVTNAYRINADAIQTIQFDSKLQSFWFEDAINIQNSYNSSDAYFLTGKEGVVFVTSPVVSININENENVIYRFKRWEIFSRYNSEVIYRNMAAIGESHDIYNAVLRFKSNEAGYFIFMPVYERVYTLNLATSVVDGPNNLGGAVNVVYNANSGNAINYDVSNFENKGNAQIDKSGNPAYFVDYFKTTEGTETKYFFKDLEIVPMLYFEGFHTGVYRNNKYYSDEVYPNFKKVNIIVYNGEFYILSDNGKSLTKINEENILTEVISDVNDGAYKSRGLIVLSASNGSYGFYLDGKARSISSFNNFGYEENSTGNILDYISYAFGVTHINDKSKVNPEEKNYVVYYNSETGEFYATSPLDFARILETMENGSKTIDYALKNTDNANAYHFANIKVINYNSVAVYTGNVYAYREGNDIYMYSKLSNIAAGELYSYFDEDGEEIVYPSLQFKTSYFDRDTQMVISANASSGYRLEGWYLAEYNEETGVWTASDVKLDDSINDSYTDIIKEVKLIDGTWYYVTDFYSEDTGRYYYSAIHITEDGTVTNTDEAIVSDAALDAVRGEYYNEGGFWYPLYRYGSSQKYYKDRTYSEEYTGEHETKAHYDAITTITSGDNYYYYIGTERVYKDGNNFYRSKESANLTFKDNKLYISTLHADMRIVAKFIEVYRAFIFAEEPDPENIEVVSVYYNSFVESNEEGSVSKRIGARSDKNGNLQTDYMVEGIDLHDFILTADESAETRYLDYAAICGTNGKYYVDSNVGANFSSYFTVDQTETDPDDAGSLQRQIEYNNYRINRRITTSGLDTVEKAAPEDLNLNNMFFDVDTNVYIVVKVHYDKQLTIHSLGMITSHVLVPVMYPCDNYIKQNMTLNEDERDEYFYYVFKVSFDRDLAFDHEEVDQINYTNGVYYKNENVNNIVVSIMDSDYSNYNPEYLVHPTREKSIVGDVLAGNYSVTYSNMFEFYDENNIKIFDVDGRNIELRIEYLENLVETIPAFKHFKDEEGNIDYSLFYEKDENGVIKYSNLSKFFKFIDKEYNVELSVAYVISKADTTKAHLTKQTQIFNVISDYFKADSRIAPIKNGTTNFINLSSIPIYTYSTSIQVIDSYDGVDFNYSSYEEPDTAAVKLKEAGLDFIQQIWTRGGYEGNYTYVGAGDKIEETKAIQSNTYNRYYTTNTNIDDMFADDFALAQNTIMALGGLCYSKTTTDSDGNVTKTQMLLSDNSNRLEITTSDGIKNVFEYKNGIFSITLNAGSENEEIYIFTGWYEQKLIEKTTTDENNNTIIKKQWSDLQLMSTQIETPFETTAYADTNIIAIFEKAEKITFSYEKNAFTINFNTIYDSLNNPIEVTDTSVSGVFTVTSKVTATITPSGSYRFDNEGLKVGGNSILNDFIITQDGVEDDGVIFEQTGGETFSNRFNLAKTINATIYAGKLINENNTSINVVEKEIVAVYLTINGYTFSDQLTSDTGLSGAEMILFKETEDDPIVVVKTQYVDGMVNNIATEENRLDSANRNIHVVYDANNKSLNISGYFDKELSGKLYIGYVAASDDVDIEAIDINAWYINEYKEFTEQMDPRIKLYSLAGVNDLFRICFNYTMDNLELYDAESEDAIAVDADYVNLFNKNFSLGPNIVGYVASAVINRNSTLNVSYKTIESLDTIDELTNIAKDNGKEQSAIDYLSYGVINWTGKKVDYETETIMSETTVNGTHILVNDVYYEIATLTKYNYDGETYTVDSEGIYVEIGGEYYSLATQTKYVETTHTVEIVSNNGKAYFYGVEDNTFNFSSSTKIKLKTDLEYYEDGTNLYKFIGWFTIVGDKVYIVSNSLTADITGGGNYFAIYAKTVKLDETHVYTKENGEVVAALTDINGYISVDSNHKLETVPAKGEDGEIVKSYVSISNSANYNDHFVAVIGSKIITTVDVNEGYIIEDLTVSFKNDPDNIEETKINTNYKTTTFASEFTVIDKDFSIYSNIVKSATLSITKIYYNSISMISAGELCDYSVARLDDNRLPSGVSNIDNIPYKKGDVITLSFSNTDDYGLIGFYANGSLIGQLSEYTVETNNGAKTYSTTYTVEGDTTIEVRITHFAKVETKTQSINLSTGKIIDTNKQQVYISYIDHYTEEEINKQINLISPIETILSGTVVTFTTSSTKSTDAFVYYSKLVIEGGSTSEVIESTENTISRAIIYDATNQTANRASATYIANYVTAYEVTVTRSINGIDENDVISGINPQDIGVFTADELRSLLDVYVTYTNQYGEETTIVLGSKKSATISAQSKDSIVVTTKIDENVANRYGCYMIQNAKDSSSKKEVPTNGVVSFEDPSKGDIDVVYYPSRTITLSRKLDNQFSNNSSLTIAAKDDSQGTTFLLGNEQTSTFPKLNDSSITDPKLKIVTLADAIFVRISYLSAQYQFAGFYVNGEFYDLYDEEYVKLRDGDIYLYVVNNTQNKKAGNKNLTDDVNINITACWYTLSTIRTYIMLDGSYLNKETTTDIGENIVNTYGDATAIESDFLASKLTMRLYGNRLTGLTAGDANLEGAFNTALQLTLATNGKLEKYMSNTSLGLIASTYAGYHFVGFYFGKDGDSIDKFEKLEAIDENGEVVFANTLTSFIPAEDITKASNYVIVAKYLTSYKVSQGVTIFNDENSKFEISEEGKEKYIELNGTPLLMFDETLTYLTQVKKVGTTFVALDADDIAVNYENTDKSYSTINYDYYYPQLSNYIALKQPTKDNYKFIGIYLNGKLYNIVGKYIVNGEEHLVVDLSDFITTNDNIYDIHNIYAEFRYVKEVDFVVRIGVDNTNDIDKIANSALDNIEIEIVTYNPYVLNSATNTYGVTTTTTYTNSEQDANSYWNKDNQSLYIKLHLPIGTIVNVTVYDKTNNDKTVKPTIGELKYYGWFMYTNQSIAGSNTAINYTTNCSFTLSESIDIVAQFPGTDVPGKTTDTQFAYRFIGNAFGGTKTFDPTKSSDIENSDIAKALTAFFNTIAAGNATNGVVEYNSYKFTFTTLANTNNLVLHITYKNGENIYEADYLFTGWYQEIKLANTKRYMFVTNTLGLDYTDAVMPEQMVNAINMMAEFVEISTIKISINNANTVDFTNISQNYNSFVNYNVLGGTTSKEPSNTLQILSSTLDDNGFMIVKTLYGSQFMYRTKVVFGYYNSAENASFNPDSNAYDDKYVAQTFETRTTVHDDETDTDTYLYTNEFKTTKTKYKFTIYQSENILSTITASATQQIAAPSTNTTAATLDRGTAGFAVSSFAKASLCFDNVVTLMDNTNDDIEIVEEDFEIDETDITNNNQQTDFVIELVAPDVASTNAEIVITIVRQNGLIDTITITKAEKAIFVSSDGTQKEITLVKILDELTESIAVKYKLVFSDAEIAKLALSSNITIAINTNNCISESLLNVVLTRITTNTDGDEITTTIKTEKSNNLTYITTNDDSSATLLAVITIVNKFALSVSDNDNNAGIAETRFADQQYTATISAKDNYSVEDITFSMKIGDNTVSKNLSDLLKLYNGIDCVSLADAYNYAMQKETIFNPASEDNWFIEIKAQEQEIIIEYSYNSKTYFTATLTFEFTDTADVNNYAYVTKINSTWALKHNVEISTTYEHVTNVNAYAQYEKLEKNTTTNSFENSTTVDNPKLVYILDKWFYTIDDNDNYVVINKLNAAFKDEIENEEFAFNGYIYGGKYIKVTEDAEDTGILVNDGTTTCSDNIEMIAQFTEKLGINFALEIEYYKPGNPLETPINYINVVENQTTYTNFETEEAVNTVALKINDAISITMIDTHEYFRFVEWYIYYGDNKLLTIENAALLLDSNFVINTLAKTAIDELEMTIDEINISDFVIIAKMKEQVTQINIEYDVAGEVFTIVTKNGSDIVSATINDGNEHLIDGDQAIFAQRIEEESYKLTIAYSKDHAPQFTVIAASYQTITGKVANTTFIGSNSAVRAVSKDGTISTTRYYKLNGFKDNLGKIELIQYDSVANAMQFANIVNSTTYTLNTTNLYLIEAGRATTYNSQFTAATISINGQTTHSNYFTSKDEMNYAALSFLVEEGTIVTINFENPGIYEYSSVPTTYSYRKMALSPDLMLSDILATFYANGYQTTYDIDNPVTAWKQQIITEEKNYYTSLNEYSNNNILDQESTYTFIANSNASFIADHIGIFEDQRYFLSLVIGADESTQFIFDDTNKDSVVKNIYTGENFVITSAKKGTDVSYVIKENFEYKLDDYNKIHSISLYDYYLTTDDVYNNEDYQYETVDGKKYLTIDGCTFEYEEKPINENPYDSTQNIHQKTVIVYKSGTLPAGFNMNGANYVYKDTRIQYTLANSIISRFSESNVSTDVNFANTKISLTQPGYQVAIGLVNNKVISTEISSAKKYMTNDKLFENDDSTILQKLAECLGEEESDFNHGWIPSDERIAYVVEDHGGNLKTTDLLTTMQVKKYKKVTLLAEKLDNKVFYGFVIISQNDKIHCASEIPVQNVFNDETLKYALYGGKSSIGILPASSSKVATVTSEDGTQKTYYAASYDSIDGDAIIIALYQSKVNVLNLSKMTFDEDKIENTVSAKFTPTPTISNSGRSTDESTNKGKIKVESLLYTSDTVYVQLLISANGFAEYKGATVKDSNSSIAAIYSESTVIEAADNFTNANSYYENIYRNSYNEEQGTTSLLDSQIKKEDDKTITYGYLRPERLFIEDYSIRNSELKLSVNPSNINYLYLYFADPYTQQQINKNDDITIYLYFADIYYTVNSEVTEYTGKKPDSVDGKTPVGVQTPYIGYSATVMATEGWKNPSYDGKYVTNEKDPYIYTWIDCNGNRLAYPVKVTSSMIKINPDDENDPILLTRTDGSADYPILTSKPDVDKVTKDSIPNTTIKYCDMVDQVYDKVASVFDYLEIDETTIKVKDNLFSVTIDGTTINSGSMKGTFSKLTTNNNVLFIKSSINNIKFMVMADIIEDSLKFEFYVYANENSGFPDFEIAAVTGVATEYGIAYQHTVTDDFDSSKYSIEFNIENYNFDDETKKECIGYTSCIAHCDRASTSTMYGSKVNGNNFSGTFYGDSLIYDEATKTMIRDTEKYPSMNLYTLMSFERVSQNVSAKLNVAKTEDSQLIVDFISPADTNKGNAAYINAMKEYFNQSVKTECDHPNYLSGKVDLIDGYDLYVIKNALTYVEAIENALRTMRLSTNIQAQLVYIMTEIISFNPTNNINFGTYSKSINHTSVHSEINERTDKYYSGMPQSGTIFDYTSSTKENFANILRYTLKLDALATRLEKSDDLTFYRINVYENFKNSITFEEGQNNLGGYENDYNKMFGLKGYKATIQVDTNKQIDYRYFGNALNYGDAIISTVKLTEHVYPHRDRGIWEDEIRGYVYIDNATSTFEGYTNGELNGKTITTYHDNDYANSDSFIKNTVDCNKWTKLSKWASGITNRGAKYAGTYLLTTHSGICPVSEEFYDTDNTIFTAGVTLKLYVDKVKTTNLDAEHPAIVRNIIVVSAIAVASVVVTVATWGAGSAVIGALALGAKAAFAIHAATAAIGAVAIGYAVYEGVCLIDSAINNDNNRASALQQFVSSLDFSDFPS